MSDINKEELAEELEIAALEFEADDNGIITAFSDIGLAGGSDGAPSAGGSKDILATPGYGNTLNQISQLDFKFVKASAPSDLAEPQDGEIKVSLYPYGERKSGDAYDSPVLVIGGTWNGVRYAPHVDYISGSSSQVAPIWIHPRSGKIEATVFSAPAGGFNNLTLTANADGFLISGGTSNSRSLTVTSGNITLTSGSNNPNVTIPNTATATAVVNTSSFTQYGVVFSSSATNGIVSSTGQGASGQPLVGAGASNPVFGNINIASYVTGILGVSNGGTGTSTTFTTGSIVFAGASGVYTQDNASLFWDDTNNTLGVGTTRTGAISGTNPSVRILGTGTSSATSSFEVQDSSANTILFVRNDGRVAIGVNTPSYDLTFGGQAARTIGLERRTTGAGQNLTVSAGGAQSGASNTAGGNLILSSGISTGGGSSVVDIRVAGGLSFGSSDNTPNTALYLTTTYTSLYTTTGTWAFTLAPPIAGLIIEPYTFDLGMVAVTNTTGYSLAIRGGSTSGDPDDNGGNVILSAGNSTGSGSSNIIFQTATAGGSGTTVRTTSTKMTLTGNGQLQISTTGSSAGLLIGGDANLYRSAADVLKTDDSFVVGVNLSILNAGTLSLYESGSVNFSSFVSGTQANDLRYTLPTSQPTTNQVLTATSVTGTGPYDIALGWVSNSTDMAIGGAVTSGTAGSVLFVGSGPVLAQDNSNLYWDDTNNTLGIGTTRTGAISGTNPSVRILGTGTSSATSSFEVQDSSANTLLFVRNDGKFLIGDNTPVSATSVAEFHLDQNNDTCLSVHNSTSGTGSSASLRLVSTSGGYGHIKSTSDVFNAPSEWAESLVIEAHTLQSGGLWLSAYTNTITLATTATNALDIQLDDLGKVGFGLAPSAHLHVGRNLALSAWGVAGAGFRFDAATYTDSSSSGTVASAVAHGFAQPAFAATNVTTYTDAASLYISNAPSASTNVTITNAYALWVDAGIVRLDGSVQVRSLTNGRVTYAGTNGLLQDSANMTFDGNRLALATTGNTGGLLIGGDANLYRSAADVLKTDDSFVVGVNLSVLNAGAFSLYESGSVNFSSFTAGTQANDLRYTLPTTQPSTNQVLSASAVSGSGPYDITLTWVTPATSGVTIGDGITGSTVGSVLFVGAGSTLAQDNANFFWDDTNNTLGIGTTRSGAISGTNPIVRILGTGTSSATSSFEVQDSAAASILFVRNDSRVGIGTNAPSYDLSLGGEAARIIGVNRRGTGAGNNLTVQSGGAQFIGTNLAAGTLILSSGTATGNAAGYVDIYSINNNGLIGGSTDNPAVIHARFGTGRIGLGTSTLTYDLTLHSMVSATPYTYNVGLLDSSIGSGHSLNIQAGSAITSADLNGGSVVLTAGNSTGSGSSSILFYTATAGGSGTTVRTTSLKMTLTGAGQLQVSTTGSSAGILLGGDAQIYRSAADVLRTPDSLTVDASLTVGTLTSTRITYAGTSGLLQDSANMTFDGSRIALAITGNTGGLLIGGDANLYRSAADVLKTDDSFVVGVNLSILNAGTLSLYESGSVNFSSFAAGTQANDLRYTLPTSQPTTNQVLTATAVSGTGPYDITLGWVSNSTDMAIGGTVTSGTTGSVLFVGSGPVLAQDNSNLYFDDTNNTLGVGTTRTGAISGTNPRLRVKGSGTTSSTSGFEVQDSSSGSLFLVRDDGLINLGSSGTFTNSTGQFALSTTGSGAGILIGGDTQLYRTGADVLRTPDSLQVDSYIGVNATPNTLYRVQAVLTTSSNVGARTFYGTNDITGNITSAFPAAAYFQSTPNAGASGISYAAGIIGSIRSNSAQAGAITEQYGIDFDNWHSGSANINTMSGARAFVTLRNTSSGTVTTMTGFTATLDAQSGGTNSAVTSAYGFDFSASLAGASTISNLTGYRVQNPSGSQTITTFIGIRINDLTRGGTNYGIYFDGTSGLSRQGVWWNGDTNLYRSAADTLKTDDAFQALSFNKVTITAPATAATLTIADGATLTVSASATIQNGNHSNTNTGDETATTIHNKVGYTQSFLLMGA